MSRPELGVARTETLSYRGKNYEVPIFDIADPVILTPRETDIALPSAAESPVIRGLNSTWNLAEFQVEFSPRMTGDSAALGSAISVSRGVRITGSAISKIGTS